MLRQRDSTKEVEDEGGLNNFDLSVLPCSSPAAGFPVASLGLTGVFIAHASKFKRNSNVTNDNVEHCYHLYESGAI